MKVLIFFGLFVILFFGFSAISACAGNLVDEDIAVKALKTQGFSDIMITDKDSWFVSFKGGGREDAVIFTALATNPAGKKVEVFVFAGWPWKGATIRSR
ncbi:MAG: hypothetical protein HYT20_02680 [Candidatus Nealsonbacteria bacterium]|nr:hypothetical protein [Candidatus Nealsonbacteria bacterium]